MEKMAAADAALRAALISEVKRRENNVRLPPVPAPDVLVRMTRSRVEPMVRGLFPKKEQDVVLGLLEKSVVFLTPGNIEQVSKTKGFSTARGPSPTCTSPASEAAVTRGAVAPS